MRILILGLNFWPEQVGVAKYTTDLAMFLAGRGHHLRIISAVPYYPQWAHYAGWSAWKYRSQPIPCATGTDASLAHVLYCPIYVPAKPSGSRRIVHLASFGASSAIPAIMQAFWRPELVVSIAPTLFSSASALSCAFLSGAPAVLHIQDLEIDAAFELGILRWRWLRSLVVGLERFLLQRFDVVSTISSAIADKLAAKGVDRRRIVLFPNGVDTNFIRPLSEPSPLRRELGISAERCVALYAGTMGQKQGLEMIAQAARDPALRDVHFVFCGDGPERASLVDTTRDLGNVNFLPIQPAERLNDLLNLADVHLLPQRIGISNLVMPSKLTGMLATGRPVVAWAEHGTVLAEFVNGCGVVIHPEDPEALVRSLRSLAEDPGERHRLGLAARQKAVAELDSAKIHEAFESVLVRAAGTAYGASATPR